MNHKTNIEIVKDFIFSQFLVNFVPGLILFYVCIDLLNVSTGEGITSFLILTTVSWTLGALLEFMFFRKVFFLRWSEGSPEMKDNMLLLFGKTGVAILIACVFRMDLKWILDIFDRRNEEEMLLINSIVKVVLFCIAGILLYRIYVVHSRKKQ
jgi:hypothetical protein